MIKFLTLRIVPESELHPRHTLLAAFNNFIAFFYATVFLVVEEYFENPYAQPENPKRKRSDFGEWENASLLENAF
jgi:hypothetical protein